jgi:uncharacterized protein
MMASRLRLGLWVVLWAACLRVAQAAEAPPPAPADPAPLAHGLLGPGGGNRLFYFPTRDEPSTPAAWGYRYESVWFASQDGTRLHGWFVWPHRSQPRGTVVFSHGNAGSMGHHLGFVMWLARAGYQVLLYDYRGFGASAGQVDRKGMIEDVQAAFRCATARKDVAGRPLLSYGHSLGGAKSITALAQQPVPGLKGVIVDGAFASYRSMASLFGGPLGGSFVTDELSPRDFVRRIAPVPLLVIHGTSDEIVPFSQGKELFERAAQPKTLFEVKQGQHGDSLSRDNGAYRKRMLAWIAAR